ncbi:hypothetical protein Hanom_Chr16g01435791 [Helianthus anomalus]
MCLIALAVVCRLWISRNDRVFKQKSTKVGSLVGGVKEFCLLFFLQVLLNELLALQLKMTLKFHILV